MKKLLSLLAAAVLIFTANAQTAPMRFHDDGQFRIMQLTDIHYTAKAEESAHVPAMLSKMIRAGKPDLIVITGDLIYSKPGGELFREICTRISEEDIPYAVALGNHDAEFGASHEELYRIIRTLPGCVNARYNAPDERQGDFVIPILSADGKREEARIYVMDSNDYLDGDINVYKGLTAEQVDWYKQQCAAAQAKNGYKSNALLFFHVPLNEYAEAYAMYPVAGFRNERECPGRYNTGLFRALVDGGEASGVFVGHDHANNYIAQKDGIALVYGRYSGSFGVYHELISGARLIDLKQGERGFTTWEYLQNGRERRRVTFPVK